MSFAQQFQKYSIPLLTNGVKLPKFQLSLEDKIKYKDYNYEDDYEFLYSLCLEGLEKKVGTIPRRKEYEERMAKELKLFKELEFCGYVLITWDIINFCRKNKIATGYARGSAAGSLVLYLIDVVNHVDPVKNNLYFERFLSKARAKFKEIDGVKHYDGSLLLDVDLDISFRQRGQVIEYLDNKYKSQTAKLLTVSTLSSKILIKEIIKTYLGWKEDDANIISDYVPKIFGTVSTIEESIHGIKDDKGKIKAEGSKEFATFAKENVEAIIIAKKLQGLYLHYGVHASAVLISADKINDIIPLQLTKDKELVTGFSMEDTLNLACKVDILGLRTATLVQDVCEMIGIEPNDINVDDKIIYENLSHLTCPHGLFQIEADCNYNVLQKIKPRNLEDLSAIVAIGRPGALQFVDQYSKYVETGEYQSVHPFFDDVFKDTGGLGIYQESLMRAANKVGFTLDESEVLRRIVGKKKLDEVKTWQSKIEEKIKENNLPKEVGDILWKILDDSASYSFNKSHSFSYATMCAATAYLKFKYPKEFFVSLLRLTKDKPNPIEEVSAIYKELPYFNIKLLPPHILKSANDFEIEGDNIRVGLGSVKSISEKALEKLKQFQNQYSNKFDIFRAANLAGLNVSVVSALILVGSLDDMLTETRAKTQMEYVLWNILTDNEKIWVTKLGEKYNYDLCKIVFDLSRTILNDKGKVVIKESRHDTISKKFNPYKEVYHYNRQHEQLSNWYFETCLLGFSYSTTLYDIYKDNTDNLETIYEVLGELPKTDVKFVAEVVEVKHGKTKENKLPKLDIYIKDHSSKLKVMLFNNKKDANIAKCEEQNGRLPETGDIIIVEGKKKDGATVFADKVTIQDTKVFLKISQLPKEKYDDESL